MPIEQERVMGWVGASSPVLPTSLIYLQEQQGPAGLSTP